MIGDFLLVLDTESKDLEDFDDFARDFDGTVAVDFRIIFVVDFRSIFAVDFRASFFEDMFNELGNERFLS